MNFSKIGQRLLNKSPKIALILIVLLAIGVQRDHLFGYNIGTPNVDGEQWTNGYAGPVPVDILTDQNGIITGVTLLPNDESDNFIKLIHTEGLLSAWNGKTLADAAAYTPDAVSGATYSSRAIIDNVKYRASVLSSSKIASGAVYFTGMWVVEQASILFVVLLSLISYLWPAKMKRFRLPLLVLSIGVIGIWQGAFVSFALLMGWVVNGTTMMQVGLLAIVALAILLPLLFGKSYYCTYLCPFGALQELAGKIPVRKFVLGSKTIAVFRWIKRCLLIAFVGMIFVNPNFDPSEWEPFAVFMINAAAVSVVVIASTSVIASIFIPKAWCRLLCPTGEILQLLQRPQKFVKSTKK